MADDTDLEPELDAAERDALATLRAPEPPAGFADRVVAAPVASPAREPARPRRRLGLVAATVAAAALAAAAVVIAIGASSPAPVTAPATGAVTVAERRSLPIGGRAVAVAEPGAVLAWTVDGGGGARVEQGGGSVFYRVDHGGPFVVATSLGEVRVTGTCFRIEVIMKPSKQVLISGTVGAALAAAIVVSVYEGGVVVANPHGSTRVGPGERATMTGDSAPSVGTTPVADLAPPEASVTREQLLARDELQRQRIAGLTSRVTDLERQLAGGGGGGGHGDPNGDDGHPFFDPGADQLAEFAKQCKVQFDLPPILGSSTFQIDADKAGEYGLTEAERGPLNEVLARLHESWAERIRAIYLDVVGETGADQGLSAQAMIQEIEDKSPGPERSAIQARIANERAGLVQPPADWSHASPIERLMRSLAALGDETEKLIGERIGADRAHALRAKDGGWPSKWSMSGCHED